MTLTEAIAAVIGEKTQEEFQARFGPIELRDKYVAEVQRDFAEIQETKAYKDLVEMSGAVDENMQVGLIVAFRLGMRVQRKLTAEAL